MSKVGDGSEAGLVGEALEVVENCSDDATVRIDAADDANADNCCGKRGAPLPS